MCEVFAGQDPQRYRPVNRSVRIGGHSTSIQIEAAFWDLIDEMSAVLLLAIVAVLVCIVGVAGVVHLATGYEILVCLLVGVIVSTTISSSWSSRSYAIW